MDEEGYILSNKYRKSIFSSLASGEKNIDFIVKKHRIIKRVALNIVNDMIEKGLVEKKNNDLFLTEKGEKLSERIES
ncbi:MAG: winged helix-turn-helix domain-containing protein [Candidatus Thermoplasmatota archaeon]